MNIGTNYRYLKDRPSVFARCISNGIYLRATLVVIFNILTFIYIIGFILYIYTKYTYEKYSLLFETERYLWSQYFSINYETQNKWYTVYSPIREETKLHETANTCLLERKHTQHNRFVSN